MEAKNSMLPTIGYLGEDQSDQSFLTPQCLPTASVTPHFGSKKVS